MNTIGKTCVLVLLAALSCAVAVAQSPQMDSGVGAPSNAVGNNGDLYYRTDAPSIYGPKANGSWPSTYSVILGRGCTTAFHIDWYCTGRGVGGVDPNTSAGSVDPNPLFGVDAGLTGNTPDSTVHTTTQVFAKYRTIDAFFSAVGYSPSRWWAISRTGNDSKCSAGTSAHALSSPCATYSRVSLKPGDALVFRAGAYTMSLSVPAGSVRSPILITNYPGESVKIDSGGGNAISLLYNSYITIDGLELVNSSSNYAGLGYGIVFANQTHIIVRNMWIHDFGDDMIGGDGLSTFLLERNITNNGGVGDGHDVYLGARQHPASNITIQDSIFYNGSSTPFQFNGRVTNLLFTRNIVHSGNGVGISLYNGVTNSTISNSLSFNNENGSLGWFIYDGNCAITFVCPYPETGNLIENNSFWQSNINYQCAIWYTNATTGNSQGNNIYRNNAIETANTYVPICFSTGTVATDLSTSTFDKNVFNGAGTTVVNSLSGSYTCTTLAGVATVANCTQADPLYVAANNNYKTTQNAFDLHLSSGSPAIRTGTATGAPSTDIQWKTRPSPPSIGAYEYSSSVITISSLSCTPSMLVGGASSTCTATLTGPAPSGGASVTLSSSSAAVSVPASLTVAAGSSSESFTATSTTVTVVTSVTLTGSYGGSSTASLIVNPVTIASLSCTPSYRGRWFLQYMHSDLVGRRRFWRTNDHPGQHFCEAECSRDLDHRGG
jgi:Right handed beta helix region